MSVGKIRRILFARSVDDDNLNAQSRNVQSILSRWRSSDWRPCAIAFREPHPAVAANPNVDVIRIRPDRIWRLRFWLIYQETFGAVFCPGLHHRADYHGLRTRAILGRRIPVIATIEGLLGSAADDSRETFFAAEARHRVFCQKLPAGRLARMERIYEMADHIIAISPFLLRMATAKYGDKVSQIPLGIDRSTFARADHAREHKRPRVVAVGHVLAHKRPDFFLALARRFPAADFVWFGEGALREPLRLQAAAGAVSNVYFPGALPPAELARELGCSDIFVLPSRSEGVPKVSLEAAAVGLPQIVFGYYETPTVIDGVNGFAVWDDSEFAERLGRLLDNPLLAARMGSEGERSADNLNWDMVAPLWEERIVECVETAVGQRTAGLLEHRPT